MPSDAEAPIASEVLDFNALTWTSVGGQAVDGGSSVMYLPNKFLKLGTSVDPDLATRTSVATAYVLDMTQTSPAWVQVASMSFPRTYQNATLLPDGTVLVTGGGTTTNAVGSGRRCSSSRVMVADHPDFDDTRSDERASFVSL